MERVKEKYVNEVIPELQKEFKYSNRMQVPKLTKIVINMGLGEALKNNKIIDSAHADLAAIAGQKPIVTKSKLAVAAFKLRKGVSIGCCVTLRGQKMYEFFDRFVNIALPAVKDFKGLNPKSFDGRGNYTVGVKEHIIFPEIDYDKVDQILGMNITFVTTAKSNDESKVLLKSLGMPIK